MYNTIIIFIIKHITHACTSNPADTFCFCFLHKLHELSENGGKNTVYRLLYVTTWMAARILVYMNKFRTSKIVK